MASANILESSDCSGPAQRFLVHVQLLSRMRDATLTKIRVDQLKLAQLGNLIDASFQSEHLRENSDLEEAKMVITWWKALVESDVASIDRDVKAENVAILRCWNALVEEELSKLSEDMHDGSLKEVPTVPFKDKIEELESVLQSINAMRSRLEEGLTVLEQALLEIGSPASLLELSLQRVKEEEHLPEEELPTTLVAQLQCWPTTRGNNLREKLGVLRSAVVRVSEILL